MLFPLKDASDRKPYWCLYYLFRTPKPFNGMVAQTQTHPKLAAPMVTTHTLNFLRDFPSKELGHAQVECFPSRKLPASLWVTWQQGEGDWQISLVSRIEGNWKWMLMLMDLFPTNHRCISLIFGARKKCWWFQPGWKICSSDWIISQLRVKIKNIIFETTIQIIFTLYAMGFTWFHSTATQVSTMRGFPKIGVPRNGWFIMEIPIKMDDLRGKSHYFRFNTHEKTPSNPWHRQIARHRFPGFVTNHCFLEW